MDDTANVIAAFDFDGTITILFTGRECISLDAAAKTFATRITTHLLRP